MDGEPAPSAPEPTEAELREAQVSVHAESGSRQGMALGLWAVDALVRERALRNRAEQRAAYYQDRCEQLEPLASRLRTELKGAEAELAQAREQLAAERHALSARLIELCDEAKADAERRCERLRAALSHVHELLGTCWQPGTPMHAAMQHVARALTEDEGP